MYCLVANGAFMANITPVDPSNDCLGLEASKLLFNFHLGQDPVSKRGDPKQPRMAITLPSALAQLEQAEARQAALLKYETCSTKDPSVNTRPAPSLATARHYSLSDFQGYQPDGQDRCFAQQFEEALIEIPAMDAVPACADPGFPAPEPGDQEPIVAQTLRYRILDAAVKVNPEVQGVWASGSFVYSKDACSAQYRFTAIAPIVECAQDQECQASKILPKAIRDAGVRCMVPAGATKGSCVTIGQVPVQ